MCYRFFEKDHALTLHLARDDTCYLNLMHLFLPKSIDVKIVMIVINDFFKGDFR